MGSGDAGRFISYRPSGLTQIRNNYRDPYIDHGPDFREYIAM